MQKEWLESTSFQLLELYHDSNNPRKRIHGLNMFTSNNNINIKESCEMDAKVDTVVRHRAL